MRLQTFGISAFLSFALGASLLYCSPAATVTTQVEAGVCDPDSGTNCPCNFGTYKPSDCYSGPLGTNGKGACKAGKRSCSAAGVLSECVGEVLPTPETCDYADNDCNGVTDDLPEFTDAAPIAYCESPACDPSFRDAGIFCFTADLGICGAGRRTCAPGASQGTPTGCKSFIKNGVPEECNAIDDDCNGQVDDGLQGSLGACETDAAVGQCAKSQLDCQDGGIVCPPSDPGVESCNGKDDDCNGKIDDKSCPAYTYCCSYPKINPTSGFCTNTDYTSSGYNCVNGK